ncbi:MAG: hypothetical protein M3070_07025 [Actinomycetota bacterium]|nr:hypothetical protein [Actinomycetota bacterium]
MLSIVLSIYWMVRAGDRGIFHALVFAALVIVALALAWTKLTSQWLHMSTNLGPQ